MRCKGWSTPSGSGESVSSSGSRLNELRIEPVADWTGRLAADVWVSGPGVDLHDRVIPEAIPRVPGADRVPGLAAVYRAGLRQATLSVAEVMRLEPLYLRPSSAEEKAERNRVPK